MKLTQMVVSFAGAVALATGFAAPSVAQTSGNVTAILAGGGISVAITGITDFQQQTFSHAGYSNGTGATFNIVVQDNRNTSQGFSVNLAASDFTKISGGGSGTIDLASGGTGTLIISSAGSVTTTAGSSGPPTAYTAARISDVGVMVLGAPLNSGNGHYTASGYALELTNVSPTVPTGTYRSTLSVSVGAAPS